MALRASFFFLGLDFVVRLLLGQVFLDLLHVGISLRRWGEDAGDVQRRVVGLGLCPGLLDLGEQLEVFDGVVDGRGGEDGIETASAGGGIVFR